MKKEQIHIVINVCAVTFQFGSNLFLSLSMFFYLFNNEITFQSNSILMLKTYHNEIRFYVRKKGRIFIKQKKKTIN